MPIQELNPQEFSKNLAQQAMSYLPEDINEEQKQYIAKKVYEFCYITGDHLIKQYVDQFTDEQAVVVIQFIGEWTFHKAIDLIRAEIRNEFWDTILQQIAFAALKGALEAHQGNMEQQQTAQLIEQQVMAAFKQCLDHLVKAQAIKEEDLERILSVSNVDKMAKESAETEGSGIMDDEKTLKCLAIAMLLKKMPEAKANKILDNMDEEERNKILSCLQIEGLEQKVDPEIMRKYIKELNKNVSSFSRPDFSEMTKSFKALQAAYGEEEIINQTMFERPKIQEFLSICLLEDAPNVTKVELSPHIVKILYSYLRNKLAA